MGAAVRGTTGDICRHLGFAGNPAQHHSAPSMDHRCHLWSLREQVDLAHQRRYCFTDAHRRCPWLSVPPPGHKPADRTLPKKRIAATSGVAALLCGVAAMATTAWQGDLPGFNFGASQLPVHAAVALAAAPPPVEAQPSPPQPESPRIRPFGELAPSLLSDGMPETVSARLSPDDGGTILAGNVGISFSPKSLSQAGGDVTVHVEAQPKANIPGGPAQFSPNGSIVDITIRDKDGKLVTTFPDPVEILFKYNTADLAMARGDASILSAAYVLDEDSPEIENPLHFPINTWVFFPKENVKLDTANGTLAVKTNAIGSIISVVAVSVGWAQTLRDIDLYSSFDPATSSIFGKKQQFSYLQVLNPQIGSRLFVRDLDGNFAYVNARDVGPSGPPPARAYR